MMGMADSGEFSGNYFALAHDFDDFELVVLNNAFREVQ
jgi:hypothetical protein